MVLASLTGSTGEVGDITFGKVVIGGMTGNLITGISTAVYSGRINMDVQFLDNDTPLYSNVASTDPFDVKIKLYNGRSYEGHPSQTSFRGQHVVHGPASSRGDVTDGSAGILRLLSPTDNSGDGAIGAGIAFTRPGNQERRGALIRVFQDGSLAREVGLEFCHGNTATSTEAVLSKFKMRNSGNFDLVLSGSAITIGGTQVLSDRVINAAFANSSNTGDAGSDALLDGLRDLVLSHGMGGVS